MKKKTCTKCGEEKPLDKEHFRYRVRNGKGAYTADCKKCIYIQKQKHIEEGKLKRKMALQEIEQSGVNVFLASITKGGNNIPHTAEVVEKVMSYFGGVSGFSSVVVKQYWDSPPGSSQRNKLLETMCRMVTRNVESGGAKKPLQFWSEEELEQELDARLAEAAMQYKGKIIDATAETIQEASEGEGEDSPRAIGYDPTSDGSLEGSPAGTEGQAGRSTEVVSTKRKPSRGTQDKGK
jgi:hypothetical protein